VTTHTLPIDVKTATRRVETAICAFGGTLHPQRKSEASSIFRLRGVEHKKHQYERSLPARYHLSGSVISWDVEENPPIHVDTDRKSVHTSADKSRSRSSSPGSSTLAREERRSNNSTSSGATDAPKMKYRCKLCGQLKQNHECPYRQSLARSIGVMVYPAVNSFTAAEPGTVAPPLTKMNNFVSYDSDHGKSEPTYPSGGTATTVHPPSYGHPSTVTPATLTAGGEYFNSPQSSLSNHSDEGFVPGGHHQQQHHQLQQQHHREREGGQSFAKRQKPSPPDSDTRPIDSVSAAQRTVFVTSVTLRPEHYRAVNEDGIASTAYQYATIPLTFAERKRLSDSLFHLSKEIPSMMADCATCLRDARKNNEWDRAVAELLTQVVVGLYCGEGDACLGESMLLFYKCFSLNSCQSFVEQSRELM